MARSWEVPDIIRLSTSFRPTFPETLVDSVASACFPWLLHAFTPLHNERNVIDAKRVRGWRFCCKNSIGELRRGYLLRCEMESLESVHRAMRLGRFGDALRALNQVHAVTPIRSGMQVLRAALLEKVGQPEEALILATTLLKSKQLASADRSECEVIVGRILFDGGSTEDGLSRLQRAALMAQQCGDLHALFGAKLLLLGILSDRCGPSAASSVLAEVRQIATKLGESEITARLHLFVAQAEAKRGLLENAKRHTSLARRILNTSPNAHLEAFTGNLDLAIAVLRCEFDEAKDLGARAVRSAEESGVAKIRRAVLGNMGNLFYELGEFDQALEYFESALAGPPTGGATVIAILDSLARTHLNRGRLQACSETLDRIESSMSAEQDRLSYECRYSALTRINLLASQGRLDEHSQERTRCWKLPRRPATACY